MVFNILIDNTDDHQKNHALLLTNARTVDRGQQRFKECGVTRRDIEQCAEQIDRPFLADQRREFSPGCRQK